MGIVLVTNSHTQFSIKHPLPRIDQTPAHRADEEQSGDHVQRSIPAAQVVLGVDGDDGADDGAGVAGGVPSWR